MEVKCYNLKKEGLTLCFETVQDFEKLNFDFQCPLKITRLWSIKGGFDRLAGFFFSLEADETNDFRHTRDVFFLSTYQRYLLCKQSTV